MRKLPTQDFIDRARKMHGDRYDYSQVEYSNNSTNVKIKCPEHGVFEQNPKGHMNGNGCQKCSGRGKRTKQDFIDEAIKVHGDKFDYSSVEYVTSKIKVKIICPIHGMFERSPKGHLKGGCQKCSFIERAIPKRRTNKQFIAEAKKIHGNKFDYRHVIYTNANAKVKIICPKHGMFKQKAYHHLHGSGCSACSNTKKLTKREFIRRAKQKHGTAYAYGDVEYLNSTTKVKIRCLKHGIFQQRPSSHLRGEGCLKCSDTTGTSDEFIKRAKLIHGDTCDYELVKYVNRVTKVKIKCLKHGIYEQSPQAHLDGSGCPECGNELLRKYRLKSAETFYAEARAVHGDTYDYSHSEYIDGKTKIKIRCSLHGVYEQRPADHLRGAACSGCAEYGFDGSKPAILYYLRVETHNQLAYKIGITNRTVQDRFRDADLEIITIIKETYYDSGQDARDREQAILKKYAHAQYAGEPILTSGNTELFRYDILQLDGSIITT